MANDEVASHTPTPWRVSKTDPSCVLAGRRVVADTSFKQEVRDTEMANAQFICTAVNAHDNLVAAVRAYLSAQGDCDCDTCTLARAALAAAEGKP